MKSNLCSTIDVKRINTFQKDFKVLIGLGPEIISKLPEYAYESMAAPTNFDTQQVYEKASKELEVPVSKLKHAINISEYFLRRFTSGEEAETDTPEDITSDLQELLKFDKKRIKQLVEYFERIKKLAKEKADYLITRKLHAQSTLPTLRSLSAVVDFRIVFDKFIRIGENVDDYSPKCLGTIPVGIIGLSLSGGSIEEISFQMDKQAIHMMIESITALEKQIDIAQRHFNLEEITKDA